MQALNPSTAGIRRFRVDEYYRMGEVGIFGDNERTELIERFTQCLRQNPCTPRSSNLCSDT